MQSIIVYRNPAEAYLWESGMMAPLMAMLVSMVILVVVTDSMCQKITWWLADRGYIVYRTRARDRLFRFCLFLNFAASLWIFFKLMP